MSDDYSHVTVENNIGRDINLSHRTLPDGEESALTMDEFERYQRTLEKLDSKYSGFNIDVLEYRKTG